MYLGNDIGDHRGTPADFRDKLFRTGLLDVRPYGLHPGSVGRRPLIFVAPAPKDLDALLLGVGRQLLGGAGPADAGLSNQHEKTPLARKGIIKGSGKLRHLPLAANENATEGLCGSRVYHACSFRESDGLRLSG